MHAERAPNTDRDGHDMDPLHFVRALMKDTQTQGCKLEATQNHYVSDAQGWVQVVNY